MLQREVNKILLLGEVPFLLVTLGLMAWALHILSLSIGYALDPYKREYYLVPVNQEVSYLSTRTVTGYRTTSVKPGSLHTDGTTFTLVGLDGHSTPSTIGPSVFTLADLSYGFDPTATRTETVTVTGIQAISHLVKGGEDVVEPVFASPAPTPAPVPPRLARRRDFIPPDQAWSGYTPNLPYTSYAGVTVNHGFGRFFFEGGIDYVYSTGYEGYSPDDLSRIRALTALMSIALACIIGRLICTALYVYFLKRSNKEGGLRIPKLGFANLGLTVLILLTYVPFWSLYGAWTHRNATVQAADAEFQTDKQLQYLDLDDFLDSTPWRGVPTALIVFWSLAIVTSSVMSLRLITQGRQADLPKE